MHANKFFTLLPKQNGNENGTLREGIGIKEMKKEGKVGWVDVHQHEH